MTKSILSLSMIAAAFAMAGCESRETRTEEQTGEVVTTPESDSVSRAYSDFLSQVKKDTAYWYDVDTTYWEGKKVEYEKIVKGTEAGRAKMSPEETQRVESIVSEYDTIYTTAVQEREELIRTFEIVKPQPKLTYIGPAALADLEKVTGENILTYYENFVATARNYRKEFTTAEWDAMKDYYEKLDAKKNLFEKTTLPKKDNRRIAGLKANFRSIYGPNRTWSKHKK